MTPHIVSYTAPEQTIAIFLSGVPLASIQGTRGTVDDPEAWRARRRLAARRGSTQAPRWGWGKLRGIERDEIVDKNSGNC